MRKLGWLLIILLVSACAALQSGRNYEKRRPFDPAEYKYVKINGTATIRGQVLIPTRKGTRKPCDGCEVTLNPATSYSEEFFIKTVQNGIPIEEPDLRVLKYIRKTVTDDSGRFEFKNIAGRKYYLYVPVVLEIPKPEGGYIKTRAYLYQSIFIREGQQLEVTLTR